MITKEKAIKIVKQYLVDRKREYLKINEDRVYLEENEEIMNDDSEYEIRNIYNISYEVEGYQYPDMYFVHIDADTGEVLYTLYKHGRVENWEEDEDGNLLEQ
jgi:cell division protein YceG involved in septum cleavage